MSGWRAMAPADLDAVTAISDAVHGRYTEPRGVYAERLALYPQGCRVLDVDGAVEGYCISHPWHRRSPPALGQAIGAIPEDADTYWLHDLALVAQARGSGAGAAALAEALALARAGGFSDVSLIAVNGADRFWSRHGFAGVEGPEGYGAGSQAMRRTL